MSAVAVPTLTGPAVWRVGHRVVAAVGVPAVAVAGLLVGSPTILTAGPVLVLVAAAGLRRRDSEKRRSQAGERLVHSVDALIGLLRSGASLSQACVGVGRRFPPSSGQPLAALAHAIDSGRSLREAAIQLTTAEDDSVRLVAVTVRVLAERGGPAVPALERLRHTLMGQMNGHRRLAAESSQAVTSAGLLVVAPTLFVVTISTVDSSIARFYLFDRLGTGVVLVAVVLSAAGWWWMCRIGRRVLEGGSC